MGTPAVLTRLAAAGIRLTPLPDGRLWAEPRAALNDELRELIRVHRAELRNALDSDAGNVQPDRMTPAEEAAIRLWLARIEETDPAIIAYLLNSCCADPSARAYFLRHAAGDYLH